MLVNVRIMIIGRHDLVTNVGVIGYNHDVSSLDDVEG